MSFDFDLSFKIPVFACTTYILFLEFKNLVVNSSTRFNAQKRNVCDVRVVVLEK